MHCMFLAMYAKLKAHILCPNMIYFVLFFRFLFVLLGPTGKARSYHEIGRAIATLMSDEVCVLGILWLWGTFKNIIVYACARKSKTYEFSDVLCWKYICSRLMMPRSL